MSAHPLSKSRVLSCVTGFVFGIFVIPAAKAEPSAVRLLPRTMAANEEAGSWPHSTVVGSGRIAMGAPDANNSAGVKTGAVYVFDEKTGAFLYALHPGAGAAGDRFGFAVVISGNRIAVGAPGTDGGGTDKGAVYVYDLKTKSQIASYATFPLTGEEYGRALAMDGDWLAIGSPLGDLSGIAAASGYIHLVNLDPAVGNTSITKNGGQVAGDHFGTSIALEGRMMAVGIPGDDTAAANAGRIQIFDIPSATLLGSASVTAAVAGDRMGSDVDLEGTLLVASGSESDDGLTNRGKVVAWSISSPSSPNQIGRIVGNVLGGFMGSSISLSNGVIAVSAERVNASTASVEVGQVNLYNRNLVLLSSVQPIALQESGRFGSSLCLSGNTLAAAAGFEDALATDSGALWKISPILAPSSLHFVHRVASKGDSTPGVTGVTFTDAVQAADTGGTPVVWAKLKSTLPSLNAGIWRPADTSGLWQSIRLAGFPTTGERVLKFTDLIAVQNTMFYRVTYTGTAVTAANADSWVFHDGIVTNTNVVRNGMTLPSGAKVAKLGNLRKSNHSDVALAHATLKLGPGPVPPVTAASDSAVAVVNGSSIGGEVREGVDNAATGTPYGQLPPAIAISGDKTAGIFALAPAPGVTTADNSIVDDNGTTVVGRKGNAAPDSVGLPIAPWRTFTGVALGSTSVVFRATMNTATNSTGLWSNRTGSTRLVLRQGDAALPALPLGVTVKRIIKFGTNNSGNILALVQLQGSTVNASNDLALIACLVSGPEPGFFQLLLREGSRIAGGAKVGVIHQLDLSAIPTFSNSFYGVLVTLANEPGITTAADNLAWLVGKSGAFTVASPSLGQPTIQLRKGLQYADVPGRDKITSIKLGVKTEEASGAFNTGRSHVIGGNFGQSTLIARHPDKSSSVVSVSY